MDLDAYVAVHEPEWQRLDVLARSRGLSGAEADELVQLYQRTATHLSTIRSSAPDPVVISRLSVLLARARGTISGGGDFSWDTVARFFVVTLPAAFYRVRWWSYGVIFASLLVAVITGWWVATHPEAQAALGTPSEIERYVNSSFEDYYQFSPDFATTVWVNNAWIAAQCIAFGVTGVWAVNVLLQNAISIGISGGVMVAHGHAGTFFGLILPHGLLELTAVFVAGAAGLRLFWAWVAPGPRTRTRALAVEGRSTFTMAVGLAIVLGISGLIEGFVTPSGMPGWLKLVLGVVAATGFWVYVLVLGRRAARVGEIGDMAADEIEAVAPVAG